MRNHGLAFDRRDLEIARLKRLLEESRAREGRIRTEERERFSALSDASRRFAASMRSRMDERRRTQRRLDAQYAVGRVLEESGGLREAAPRIFHALAERLGWEAGVLWTVEEGVLRCRGVWRLRGLPPEGTIPGGFEEACLGAAFPRGAGLPGRAWEREEACWVEDVLENGGHPHGEAAAAEGLRCALAFPIQDGGRPVGVFELLREEKGPADEDTLRVVYLLGQQIGQFVERRRAEEERDRLRRLAEEGRARLHAVLQQMPGGVFIAEPGGRISLASEGAMRIYGREIRSIEECGRYSLSYPGGEPVPREAYPLNRALAGEPVSMEHFVERADGTRGIVSANAAPVLDEEGRVVAAVKVFQDVTELLEARRAVEDRERRYRTLATNIPGAVFRASVADGRPSMEFVSDRIEEITGHPARDFVSDRVLNYGDVIHPEDRPHNDREVSRALKKREPYNIEYRILPAGGGVRWANERGSGAFSEGGELLSVDGAIFDVTGRKRAEEALRGSEEKYRTLFESIDEGFCIIEKVEGEPSDFRYVEANPALTTQSGMGDVVGRTIRQVLPGEAEGWIDTFDNILGSGESLRFERDLVSRGRVLELYAFRVEDETYRRVAIIFKDVTGRKKAEETLRENDEWLGIAQRAARSGTWEWDLVSGEIRWSDEHRALFGFDPEEPVTREGWWGTIHPEDLPRIEEAGGRCSEEGEEWPEIEYRILRDGETRWIDARGRTVRNASGRPVRILGISVDMTERKTAEAERDRLLAREWVAGAEAAERERISRELHDRVAHSMGVAHQSLQIHEVLATKDAGRAAEKLELAKEMTKAALESTRNLSAELRHLEAEDNLEAELRHLLDVSVPPHVGTELHVAGDEADVPGYVRGQMFLVLREAVRNAVSHSGCATISVGLDIRPEEMVGRVEDDGRGFEATGGNGGVGLRSMRERAALLDGALDLDCEPGRGTRIAVAVPLGGDR